MCRTDSKNEKILIVHVIISNSDSSWNLAEQVFVFTNMQILKMKMFTLRLKIVLTWWNISRFHCLLICLECLEPSLSSELFLE